MFFNYLKLAIRLLIRNPFFAFVNVLGLSIGFAVFFVLWNHSQTELTADQYHADSDRIARIGIDWQWTDDGKNWGRMLMGHMSPSTTHQISQDFPEVESILRLLHQPVFNEILTGHGTGIILTQVSTGGKLIRFKEQRAIYSDPNLFEFFSIPLVYGQSKNVLAEKNSVVLSAATARKYFGEKNPVGELLTMNGSELLKVTGVFEDLPRNTHLAFDLVISNRSKENAWNSAFSGLTNCYVKLKDSDLDEFAKKVSSKWPVYWAEATKNYPHVKTAVILQPLKEIAFEEEFSANFFIPKSNKILIGLASVSITILIMAWANYINLTISRTKNRMKELATRKMSGALTSDFIRQFVTETLVINFISAIFAATVVQFIRQPANLLLDIHVPEMMSVPTETFIFFFGVFLVGVLFTGLYPAMLSTFRSPQRLFLVKAGHSRKKFIPSIFTTTQYISAIVLIFFGMVIHQQLKYILDKDLGFDKDNVLIIDAPVTKGENYLNDVRTFANESLKQHSILNFTIQSGFINLGVKATSKDIFINTNGYTIDERYLSLFKISLLAGRNFVEDDRANAIILTRFAAERLNYTNPKEAIGQKILTGPNDQDWREMEIIGVVENYKTTTFYRSPNNSEAETGRGIAFLYGNKAYKEILPEMIMVKVDSKNVAESLAALENKFSEVFPESIFNSSFLDNQISNIYENERLTRNQLTFFTCLAIGIACLGVLGMITNKMNEKRREIAIRKLMGAGVKNIGNVLLSDTLKQIVVAVAIAMPVAYYFSDQYLSRFTDRIPMQWWNFTLPVALLLVTMFITISFVLIQAARTNPVDSLRQE